jgi:hypothetical protein
MSLLTDTQGSPNRVFGLLRLLAEAGTPLPLETVEAWLTPRNKIGNAEVPRPKDALGQTLGAARSLNLIADGTPITLKVEVPSSIQEFSDLAHRQLLSSTDEDANSVVLKVYAWFVLRADRQVTSLHRTVRDELVAEIDGAFPRPNDQEARTFNTTKLAPWVRWMTFLGLGMELPSTPFFPSPVERVLRELRQIAEKTGFDLNLDFREIQKEFSKRMPYLDGGALFSEMAERTGWRPKTVSRVLSHALRELHDEGAIRLTALGDSAKRVPFAHDPNDLTRLTGADSILIVQEAPNAV